MMDYFAENRELRSGWETLYSRQTVSVMFSSCENDIGRYMMSQLRAYGVDSNIMRLLDLASHVCQGLALSITCTLVRPILVMWRVYGGQVELSLIHI